MITSENLDGYVDFKDKYKNYHMNSPKLFVNRIILKSIMEFFYFLFSMTNCYTRDMEITLEKEIPVVISMKD